MLIFTDNDRREYDFYPTPYGLCEAAIKVASQELLHVNNNLCVLDPGSGNGVWGTACKNIYSNYMLDGIELQSIPKPEAYDNWVHDDYLSFESLYTYDFIIGNPPYNLAEDFIKKSLSLLEINGVLVFLLRLDFLAGEKRRKGIWKTNPPYSVHICSRRPSFNTPKNRKTDGNSYAIYIWVKGYNDLVTLSWLEWEYNKDFDYV